MENTTRKNRKAQVAWYGDKNNLLGTMWLYRKQKPEVFGFAKGIVLGLQSQWKEPFVLVKLVDGGNSEGFVVTSPYQRVMQKI